MDSAFYAWIDQSCYNLHFVEYLPEKMWFQTNFEGSRIKIKHFLWSKIKLLCKPCDYLRYGIACSRFFEATFSYLPLSCSKVFVLSLRLRSWLVLPGKGKLVNRAVIA